MITLSLLLITLIILATIIFALVGILAVAWPIVLVLVIGLIIDVLAIKLIFKKKKKEDKL